MKKFLLPAAILIILAGCAKETDKPTETVTTSQNANTDAIYEEGVAIVQFDDNLINLVEDDLKSGNMATKSAALNSVFGGLGIKSIRRVFADAGQFEPRARRYGLHKWYKIEFDSNTPVTKAQSELGSIPGIVKVEKSILGRLRGFNDPRLKEQWHYINPGTGRYRKGLDINVEQVWEDYTVGSDKVIVAVNDGGIDPTHPDLTDNLIPAGANGSKNFLTDSYKITPHTHGTHVGGTLAAVNNNGIGVSGVAGGDKAKGQKGVRLLSCQIFDSSTGKELSAPIAQTAAAFTWAADHGAVISQNSWGYIADSNQDGKVSKEELETYKAQTLAGNYSVLKDAIDYFIDNAGCDNEGNQLPDSPMKGGIVIFSAGNENIDYDIISSYDRVISVGATDAAGKKASFSNYGKWVDVCAPGTDILSTYPQNEGAYGLSSGTSMSCPQVSGIAALIVSYYGGPGFTADALKEKLLNGARSGFIPETEHIGNLVDALGSMTIDGKHIPEPVAPYTVQQTSNSILCKFNLPKSASGKRAYGVMAVAAKNRMDIESFNPADPSENAVFAVTDFPKKKAGEEVSADIKGLEFNTKYYIALFAKDYSGHYSAASEIKEVTTLDNNAPVISGTQTDFTLRAFQTIDALFDITDPDGHKFTVDFTAGSAAATLTGDAASRTHKLKIIGKNAPAGTYTAKIKATDEYGKNSVLDIKYTILKNNAPSSTGKIEDKYISDPSAEFTIDMSEIFSDADGEPLTYSLSADNGNIIAIKNVKDNKVTFKVLGYGLANVNIKATDALNDTALSSFRILVRDEGINFEAYPNPVRTTLNLRGSVQESEAEVRIETANGSVVYDNKVTLGAFTPHSIDMTSCAPGKYLLTTVMNGETYRHTFIKL